MPLLRVVFQPARGWAELHAIDPPAGKSLLRVAAPLSALPALAWPLGNDIAFLPAFLSTSILSLATVLLLAAGIYLLAPFFNSRRHWARAVAVAVYATSPVFLSGALLVVPILVIASVLAFLHYLVLCSQGLQVLLGCSPGDSAGFVASATVLAGLASVVMGAICSAAGLI